MLPFLWCDFLFPGFRISIPQNSYNYLYFSDNTSDHIKITQSNGHIQIIDLGLYLFILRINIYDLKNGEYVDFAWNDDLEVIYRIEGNGAKYTSMTITYTRYVETGFTTLGVLFNRTNRELQYAFCNIFIWKMPL